MLLIEGKSRSTKTVVPAEVIHKAATGVIVYTLVACVDLSVVVCFLISRFKAIPCLPSSMAVGRCAGLTADMVSDVPVLQSCCNSWGLFTEMIDVCPAALFQSSFLEFILPLSMEALRMVKII
jgi:hypothetical protein